MEKEICGNYTGGLFFSKEAKKPTIFQKARIFCPLIDCSPLTTTAYITKIAVLEAGNADLRLQLLRIPLLESENAALKQEILVLSQNLSTTLAIRKLSIR